VTQQIIVLYGIDIRDHLSKGTEDLLAANCDVTTGATNTYTFPKGAGAKALYEVQVKFELADFANAVNTPDAVVLYTGHSRYGQGPAFGPAGIGLMPDAKKFPINPWGVHYRMGYDATDTKCIADLMLHSITPTEFDLPAATSSTFLSGGLSAAAANARNVPPGAGCLTPGAWREFNSCQPGRSATPTARGDTPLKDRHFYAQIPEATQYEFMTAVAVGSADLDKSNLPGKLLVMGSCSSHVHYFGPLDRRRQAVKSTCKFILTSELCYVDLAKDALKQVLVNGIDPTTPDGMKKLAKALNGVKDSGLVGLY
jgi:hypothetical protein